MNEPNLSKDPLCPSLEYTKNGGKPPRIIDWHYIEQGNHIHGRAAFHPTPLYNVFANNAYTNNAKYIFLYEYTSVIISHFRNTSHHYNHTVNEEET